MTYPPHGREQQPGFAASGLPKRTASKELLGRVGFLRAYLAAAVAAGLLAAAATVAQMALLAAIVAGAFLGGEGLAALALPLLLLLGAVVARAAAQGVREVVAQRRCSGQVRASGKAGLPHPASRPRVHRG